MSSITYADITEQSGSYGSPEQIQRMAGRYAWAAKYCAGKDVVEVACGTGQGLGLLARAAHTVVGLDLDASNVKIASSYYQGRIEVITGDGARLPFPDRSKDVIILFEAIYYLPSAQAFLHEARRVLKSGGLVLISTTNKDLFDFIPSPLSVQYYGVSELNTLLRGEGYTPTFLGETPISQVSVRQRLLRPLKLMATTLGLVPKTMKAKERLKRMLHGRLERVPNEVTPEMAGEIRIEPISAEAPNHDYKGILCAAAIAT